MATLSQIIGGDVSATIEAYLTPDTPSRAWTQQQLPQFPTGVSGQVPISITEQYYDGTIGFGYLEGSATFTVVDFQTFSNVTSLVLVTTYQGREYLVGWVPISASNLNANLPEEVTVYFTLQSNCYVTGT